MVSKLKSTALFLICSLVILNGCKQKASFPTSQGESAFNSFIHAYSSGIIKGDAPIQIQFADLSNLGDIDPASLISFSPEIAGEAGWKDVRTLEFYPNDKWSAGENYTAWIHLDKIPGLQNNEDGFTFSFDIQEKSYTVEQVRLLSEDPNNLNSHQIEGVIQFSEEIDANKLEKALTLSNKSQDYNITWQHDLSQFRHVFRIENILRENKSYDLNIGIKGAAIDMPVNWSERVRIPPAGSFQFVTHRISNGPQQFIEIDFSDPLNTKQEMEGKIKFRDNTPFRLVIDQNQIRIFPHQRLIGTFDLTVFNILENIKGQEMSTNHELSVVFFDEKPQVALINEGAIVPRSNGLRFPFRAVNVRAVRLRIAHILEEHVSFFLQRNDINGGSDIKRAARLVFNDIIHLKTDEAVDFRSWNTYYFNLEQYVDVEPGAIYRVYLTVERPYSLYPCQTDSVQSNQLVAHDKWNPRINESDVDYWNYYGYAPEVDWRNYRYDEAEDPCTPSYFMSESATVSQSIIASDLGLLAKAGEDDLLHVAVSDILSGAPLSGVELEVFTFQHTLIGTGTTDSDGFSHMELTGKPFLLVARKGADYGYLRLDDGSVESVSMFQVEGQKNAESIKAFLYGERGVWRPGDSIYLQCIVQDKHQKLPDEHPIIFELYNARGQLANRQVRPIGKNNIHDFRLKTKSSDLTGNWRALVKIGNNAFEKIVRIETIKPNRLTMDIDFPSDIIDVTSGKINGNFSSKWLHGAKAAGLDSDIKLKLTAGRTVFEKYKGFQFDDISKSYNSSETEIYKGALNEQGEVKLSTSLRTRNAPGMLTGQFTSRVYEQGGEFSIDRKTVQLSPYQAYVGIKVPKGSGWQGALKPEDSKVVRVVMLNPQGKPINGQVEIKIYGLSWRWWYDHDRGENMTNFMRSRDNRLVHSKIITLENGEAFYDLPELDGFGQFVFVAKHAEGKHSSAQLFRYWWGMDTNDKESAKMLPFELNKSSYEVGEEIITEIPSNGTGYFIATLESGGKVVQWNRIKAEKDKTRISFYADRELIPNAYFYVAYIQPHAQTANDLPIRMFGVQPVFIEDGTTHLDPILAVTDKWEPEKEVEIKVTENQGQSMEYSLAIVDEGLLQLTRYQTPDPWSAFHQKEALAVRTWDIYDNIIGAHAGEMAGLLAMGGDGSIEDFGAAESNRFPPMVRFLGPFSIEKNDSRTHVFQLPNYVGQVRVMLVAATDRAYGHASISKEVKKPLMVLASLPRVVGPGESLSLPVTTFAMEPEIKNVQLTVMSNSLFNIKKGAQQIKFNGVGDQVTYFPIAVGNRIGQEKVTVIAEGHGQRAQYEIDIEVRPSNPPVHKSHSVVIEPNSTGRIPFSLPGIAGTNSLAIEAANGIIINFGGKGDYLFAYPHGCIEQTTSRAFPQLYASGLMEVSDEEIDNIENNIQHAIDRLFSFQLSNGGLGYWPNARSASPWGTSYGGHFMLEAQRLGYKLPAGFIKNWIRYQKEIANNWLPKDYGVTDHGYQWSHELMQAYRLYTLALADEPQIGAMNRLRGEKNLSLQATWRLALSYHLVGRTDVAKTMIASADLEIEEYKNYGPTFGSAIRDRAMILETLVAIEQWDRAQQVAEKIAAELQSDRWYSTQSTAYSFLSLFKFLGDQDPAPIDFAFAVDGMEKIEVKNDEKIFFQSLPAPSGKSHELLISNRGEKRLFVNLHTGGIPLEGDEERGSKNLKMEVAYYNMTGKEINPREIERGQDFIASVRVTNEGLLGNYAEMALTQIFPSGWEIHNTRLDQIRDDLKIDRADYRDVRDDRVYTYFDLPAGKSQVYQVKLTAVFPGRYYQPAVFCEAMYDRDIYALEPGQWIDVKSN